MSSHTALLEDFFKIMINQKNAWEGGGEREEK